MNDNTITSENIFSMFPDVLKSDSKLNALAFTIADKLAERPNEITKLSIFTQIDKMPEGILDILAHDFKVDWWDPEYNLQEKRKILKDSFRIHKINGTKGAVEDAISAIYPNTKVLEWFEYDGEPYRFKLLIDAVFESVDPKKHQRVLERIKYYKNLRSHLDVIEYVAEADGTMRSHIGAKPSEVYITMQVEVNVYGLE